MATRNVKSPARALAQTRNATDGSSNARPPTTHTARAIDGLTNLVAGMGTMQDKRTGNGYLPSMTLTRFTLESMYRDSWLAKRIVNSVADDMTREWFDVNFDGNTPEDRQALAGIEKRFNVKGKTNEALRWARLYGGAVIIIGIGNDDLSTPLDITKIKKDSLKFLHVLDRWRVSASSELNLDLTSPHFGMPNSYIVAESAVQVHHTRVLRFDGDKLPYFLWQQNARWDDSVLQVVYNAVSDNDQIQSGIATMLFEANIDVITSENLADELADDAGTARVAARYANSQMMKSYIRTLLLDATEKYEKKGNNFANLDKIWDKFMLCVCGASEIPATRLFGMSPAGLSATGENDTRNYYDKCSSGQDTSLRRPMEYLYEIMIRSALGRLPDNFDLDFNALWQVSSVEQSTIDKNRSDTDVAYINAGVVTEGIVARELKERGVYPNMTDDELEMIEELAAEKAENPPQLPFPQPGQPVPKVGNKTPVDDPNQAGTIQTPADNEDAKDD